MAKFLLTAAHTALLAGIAAGTTTHVPASEEVKALAKEGYLEVNTGALDGAGNAAVSLTEKGTASAGDTDAGAGTPLFTIATNVELPAIRRNGAGGGARGSKYPLKDIPLGGALFIAAAEGKTAKNMSKQFGSVVADFNKENPDKYLTSRTVEDGAAFGPQFAGKAGIGIFSRPTSERKVRNVKVKDGAAA